VTSWGEDDHLQALTTQEPEGERKEIVISATNKKKKVKNAFKGCE
jgi:uncharacterized protein YqhQ